SIGSGYSAERVRAFGSTLLETLVHPEHLQRALAHHRGMAEMPDGEIVELDAAALSAGGRRGRAGRVVRGRGGRWVDGSAAANGERLLRVAEEHAEAHLGVGALAERD